MFSLLGNRGIIARGSGCLGGGGCRDLIVGTLGIWLDLALEDFHRLAQAACQHRDFGCTEEEQNDGEDDDGVPSVEICKHELWTLRLC
jgi:hypothetical protein